MRVHFHGAAGEVTGSLHEVEAEGRRLLLDCGMIQGSPEAERRNFEPFPFEPAALDALIISHAHIDHIGRVPLLVKRGFRGPIYAQAATAALMPVMLLDAASISEGEAERVNRHRRNSEPEALPLYTREDVQAAMERVQPLPYDTRREIFPGVEIAFRETGHILGSASVELWTHGSNKDGRKLVFSGDIGPKGTPILRDPATIDRADLVLMESTYGDRLHRDRADTIRELGGILDAAWRDGGNVLIPAFAVGRSQELLYWFARHWEEWGLARWRIFLDSPMAAKVVDIYDRHADLFDEDAKRVWREKPNPFRLPNLHVTASREESMAINRIDSGAIVIAGSGMANAGRILHHFRHRLDRRSTHVVFVGYQAEGTIGRRLVDGARWIRIHGRDVRVNAQRHTVGGLSAHADQRGLIDWYGAIAGSGNGGHPPLALVHGEDKAREALSGEIGERFGVTATLARPGTVLQV
ncbi:MAG TPA: MBL fold metallo-hydrolase [Lysobacter sp.]